jgi:hypothetical protein
MPAARLSIYKDKAIDTVKTSIVFYLFLSQKESAMQQSEVAQLRRKIVDEYEAMKRGLTGLALGSAQHAFIDARMKRVDDYHNQLSRYIGEQKATQTISELYTQIIG